MASIQHKAPPYYHSLILKRKHIVMILKGKLLIGILVGPDCQCSRRIASSIFLGVDCITPLAVLILLDIQAVSYKLKSMIRSSTRLCHCQTAKVYAVDAQIADTKPRNSSGEENKYCHGLHPADHIHTILSLHAEC